MDYLNEEELRSTLVVPLLFDLGFSYTDIKLETSFSIQLGRGVFNLLNEQKKYIGGRLDILCKVDNVNLFLIELKAENVNIDFDKDKKQGLSYARLLEPMAPIVILSNGLKTKLFNTFTGSEIEKSEVISGNYQNSIGDEVELRYQALKSFVGYSEDNLKIFCKSFNENYLKKYRCETGATAPEILQKKYSSEIFIDRGNINEEFENFLSNQQSWIFPIIGESGTGKTNSIINLYEQFNEYPSIFYSGTDLGPSLFDQLKFDFNLEFSPNETELSLLKKISAICTNSNVPFIIFIDALDEWIAVDAVLQLDRLTKVLTRYHIKLCISCKDLKWNSFLSNKGLPTELSNHLYNEQKLESFSESELFLAAERYCLKLGLNYTKELLPEDFKNPFNLRIACEVCKLTNKRLEFSENSRQTLHFFIEQKLIKTAAPEKNRRFLTAISKELLKSDIIQIGEDFLRSQIGLGIHEEIPIDLFISGFLYKNVSDKSDVQIGFYFSKIRDFIISTDVLKLANMNISNLAIAIKENINTYIGENAINYYFKTGTSKEKTGCIDAFIDYDLTHNTTYLFRILAQQNSKLIGDLEINDVQKILSHAKHIVSKKSDWELGDKEIVKAIKSFPKNKLLNNNYIEILLVLDKSRNHDAHLFYNICEILGNTKDKATTDKLVELALDRSLKGNNRRFILDSLEYRKFDVEDLFNKLLNEAYKFRNLEPIFYSKHWYRKIESIELRSKLLEMLRKSKSKQFKTFIFDCLAKSHLSDTGEILFNEFENGNYKGENLYWLTRALCSIKFKDALPKFMEILLDDPNSELAGHILIGVGDMKAKQVMPTLHKLIENLSSDKNLHWIIHAFRDLAVERDFVQITKLYYKTSRKLTKSIILLIVSEKADKSYYKLIIDGLADSNIDIQTRCHILSTWSRGFMHDYSRNDGFFIAKSKPHESKLSEQQIIQLYNLFSENTKLSPYALSFLINIDDQVERLSNHIKIHLINIEYQFLTRQHSIENVANLQALGKLINPWLKLVLNGKLWHNKVFLFNCIQLAGILGDVGLLETIHSNREAIISNHTVGLKYIEYIEHIIRTGSAYERISLDL